MTKKFISWLSLLTVVMLLVHSCRTDIEATSEHKAKSGEHLHQQISTTIFQKETFLGGVNDFKSANNSLSGKGSTNSDYLKRFSIDESSIYKMDVNSTQTYALRAYNIFESAENVYNLVYKKQNNEITFSIVKILPDEIVPVYDSQKGIVTKISNPQSARTCTDFYSIELWHCKEGVSWSQCDKCSNCLSYSSGYTSYECGGGTSHGSGDGGGGGGSGIYDPSGYIFDPNVPPSIEPSYIRAARASSFFTQLNDQSKTWAVEHADIYCSILEYYLDHIPPTSPPPNSYYWDFANFAIQLFMEHPDLTWEQFYNQFINTPCEKIKAQTNNVTFKNNITSLEGKTGESSERGYRMDYKNQTPDNPIGTGSNNQFLQNKPGSSVIDYTYYLPSTYAILHTHFDTLNDPIFSWGDIIQFNEWLVKAKEWNDNPAHTIKIDLTKLTYTLVTSQGNYTLTFDGTDIVPFPNYTKKELKDLNDKYIEKVIESNMTVANVSGSVSFDMEGIEEEFLRFAKKYMNMPGMKLFKITSSGNTEIFLKPNNNRDTKPCN